MIPAPSPQSAALDLCGDRSEEAIRATRHSEGTAYRERLYPWCVVRQLPSLQNLTVAHFRRRNDAEEYVKTVRRLTPGNYVIVFDR
jgi:hypothetical protein